MPMPRADSMRVRSTPARPTSTFRRIGRKPKNTNMITEGSTPMPTTPTSTPRNAYDGMVSPTEVSVLPRVIPQGVRYSSTPMSRAAMVASSRVCTTRLMC